MAYVVRGFIEMGLMKAHTEEDFGVQALEKVAKLKLKGGLSKTCLPISIITYMEEPKGDKNPITVFVDADAFVALAREDDTNHSNALYLSNTLQSDPPNLPLPTMFLPNVSPSLANA